MSILAAGAGAADGLKDYLVQMLREAQLHDEKTRTAESGRHNLAEEGLQGRQIDESAATRRLQQEALAAEHQRTQANTERDDTRAALDDVMGGSPISIATRDKAVKTGAAVPERFKEVIPFDRDFMGPVDEKGPQRGEVGSYTLGENPKKNATADTNQLHDFVDTTGMLGVKGKHIQAFVDPKTKKIFAQNGDDITGKVDPYVKPDQVLIQSGDGYMRRPDAASKLAKGEDVPLATTSSTRTMEEGAKMLRPHIPKLSATAEELEKMGQFGPVMSRIRHAAEKLGTTGSPEEVQASFDAVGRAIANDPELNKNRLVGKFATSLGLMTSGAGRVHGGARGGGSIQMINYMKSLLSDSSDINMFLGRLDSLDEYIGGYADGPGGDKVAPAGDDLYQQYLNRKP